MVRSAPRWTWISVARFDPKEILRADHTPEGVALRCWVDVVDPKRARLYFAARSGQQFLLRDVELSGHFDEVDRESLSQVLGLSIAALLENEQAGLTRAQTQTLLASREPAVERGESAPSTPPDRAPHTILVRQDSPALTPSGFAVGVFYAAQAIGSGLPIVHGPGLSLLLGSFGSVGIRSTMGVWLSGQYQLPQRESGASVGMRWETIAARGGLELRLPVGGTLPHHHIAARLGVGADLVRISPEPGSVDPAATLTPARWSQSLIVSGALRWGWAVADHISIGVDALVDILPTVVHYDLAVAGSTSPVFSPWRVRPGLAFDIIVR